LYNPLIPTEELVTARRFLPCMTSRTTIIRVRRMLSEAGIERYITPKLGTTGVTPVRPRCWKYSVTIPIPILMALVQSVESQRGRGEIECVPKEARYMRQGRAIAQRFVE